MGVFGTMTKELAKELRDEIIIGAVTGMVAGAALVFLRRYLARRRNVSR